MEPTIDFILFYFIFYFCYHEKMIFFGLHFYLKNKYFFLIVY